MTPHWPAGQSRPHEPSNVIARHVTDACVRSRGLDTRRSVIGWNPCCVCDGDKGIVGDPMRRRVGTAVLYEGTASPAAIIRTVHPYAHGSPLRGPHARNYFPIDWYGPPPLSLWGVTVPLRSLGGDGTLWTIPCTPCPQLTLLRRPRSIHRIPRNRNFSGSFAGKLGRSTMRGPWTNFTGSSPSISSPDTDTVAGRSATWRNGRGICGRWFPWGLPRRQLTDWTVGDGGPLAATVFRGATHFVLIVLIIYGVKKNAHEPPRLSPIWTLDPSFIF